MKRARGEADGDSDAEDPGIPPEVEGPGQEEDDEAEYFRQAVGEEPDEGMWQGPVQPGTMGLYPCALVALTQSPCRYVPKRQVETAHQAFKQEAAGKESEAQWRH